MEKFTQIVSSALKELVSDIYITGGHPVVTRKLGNIHFLQNIRWTHQEVDALVRYLLDERQIESLISRKSLDFAVSVSNARLRINVFFSSRGLSLAIRILPGHIPSVAELNLHPSLNDIAGLKSGLVITCGPTGMGKTTTIAAIIEEMNRTRAAHIICLENPIEYRFRSNKSFIQQRELGAHMPSFEQGLLDVLRENPDVIVISELREPETMRLALNAAESGHLVIATLHAATPEEAIYRLCNAVEAESQNEIRFQIASTLNWLIVQQLVYMDKLAFRVPLLSIVRGTSSVRNIIRDNKLNQLESAMQIGKNEGMFSTGRYLSEYLENQKKFIPPLQTFRPSEENVQENIIYSPMLREGKGQVASNLPDNTFVPKAGPLARQKMRHDDEEGILNIDIDDSLSDLVNDLNVMDKKY